MKKIILTLVLAVAAIGQAQAEPREYIRAMGFEEAWKITRGSEDLIVATLNTGVNYHLPEFAGRIARDKNGSYGYDAVTDTFDPMDRFQVGLGTQLASVIGGNSLGLAPGVKLLPVRVFDENGFSSDKILVRGLLYAIERGARIVEIGAGPLSRSAAFCEAMKKAEGMGVLLVAPAGNGGQELRQHPEGCPLRNFVSVASIDSRGELSRFSNYGFPAVKLATYGEGVWGISRDGIVVSDRQGTSFSSAVGAAVAALVWSAHPEYNVEQVVYSMIRGSVRTASLAGKVLSNGYLHALDAIHADPNSAVK